MTGFASCRRSRRGQRPWSRSETLPSRSHEIFDSPGQRRSGHPISGPGQLARRSNPMQSLPRLAAMATAVPRYRLDQEAVIERVQRLFAGAPELARVLPVFANSGIRRRYSPAPLEWFDRPHGWADRNRLYLDASVELLETAAGRALDQAGLSVSEIGAIVVVSTTGIATPSLDALMIERLRLPPTVQRLPIFGLGCAGGALGLARAATIAAAMPDKAVLLLVVELCSLSFRRSDDAKSSIVATALFGDGAA